MKALEGMLVLDFSQYLAGPSAALRLADLGARVVKIERPGVGDNSRGLIFKNLVSDGDSVLFHTINRNKESFVADLKDPHDMLYVKELIKKADVIIENFRPGIMKRLGLGYEVVREMNPGIVYGTISGYGTDGPWVKRPGQDLMVQSVSGITWLNGDDGQLPIPIALAFADSFAGIHLAQGIMACLLRRFKTGKGGLVEVSLLEAILDLQFECFATFLNNGHQLPQRSRCHNAHAFLGAPYGIYPTSDDYISLAMGSVVELGDILDIEELKQYQEKESWFEHRDTIKEYIAAKLATNTTVYWKEKLESAGFWCSEVYNWKQILEHPAFEALDMLINVGRPGCEDLVTTRCPIRMDGIYDKPTKWAPRLGEDTQKIISEYNLDRKKGEN